MMSLTVVKCPQCGQSQEVTVNTDEYMELQYCDVEDVPGCGAAFTTMALAYINVTVHGISVSIVDGERFDPRFGVSNYLSDIQDIIRNNPEVIE